MSRSFNPSCFNSCFNIKRTNREAPHFIVNLASSASCVVQSQDELAGLALLQKVM